MQGENVARDEAIYNNANRVFYFSSLQDSACGIVAIHASALSLRENL
ncbi:hypothetical protein [Helicobacter rodentium]|nr:hypothetical protein [Helicobacter rodentium]